MKCKCCKRCLGKGDQETDTEQIVGGDAENAPLKHFGIDKRYSDLVAEKKNKFGGGDETMSSTNTTKKRGSSRKRDSSGPPKQSTRSTSEVSEEHHKPVEGYQVTSAASGSLLTGATEGSTEDHYMIANELENDQTIVSTAFSGSTTFQHLDRDSSKKLEGYEWHAEAKTVNRGQTANRRASVSDPQVR